MILKVVSSENEGGSKIAPIVGYWSATVMLGIILNFRTLSEKLEYLFFSPRTFQCYFMNIYNKYFGKILFRIFPNFNISWYITKYSEVHLKNCLLIQFYSISQILNSLVSLVDRVLASYMGGPWIISWEELFCQYRDKTSEYSEIYREQLTLEHFLPYNYRSSTLPRISRNIGQLLRQCSEQTSVSCQYNKINWRFLLLLFKLNIYCVLVLHI